MTFNGTNVTDVPFRLPSARDNAINVTVCPVDDSSLCQSVNAGLICGIHNYPAS